MLPVWLLTLPLLFVPQAEGFDEDDAVEAALQAVSEEVDISESGLDTYQVFADQWRDSSLGCPRPGMAYLPVITRGYRVFLRETDEPLRLYEVHVAPGEVVVCQTVDPNVVRTLPKPEGDQMARELRNAPRMARLAREDLAARLGVDPADIVVSVIPRTWLDTSLGCPEEGGRYEDTPIEGFFISLQVGEDTYSYHADSERVFLCEPAEPEP